MNLLARFTRPQATPVRTETRTDILAALERCKLEIQRLNRIPVRTAAEQDALRVAYATERALFRRWLDLSKRGVCHTTEPDNRIEQRTNATNNYSQKGN